MSYNILKGRGPISQRVPPLYLKKTVNKKKKGGETMLNEIRKAIEHLATALVIRLNNEQKMKEWGWETIQTLAKEISDLITIYEDIEGEENI